MGHMTGIWAIYGSFVGDAWDALCRRPALRPGRDVRKKNRQAI